MTHGLCPLFALIPVRRMAKSGQTSHLTEANSPNRLEAKGNAPDNHPRRLCSVLILRSIWVRGQDLNLRPSGYEPDELPGCSTPHQGVRRGGLFRSGGG